MTRRDVLQCIHEPFGDAFYFGPERLSERYARDEEARIKSGFANTTYRDVVDSIEDAVANVGARVTVHELSAYLDRRNESSSKTSHTTSWPRTARPHPQRRHCRRQMRAETPRCYRSPY
jgi:hypothetical protein